jgi:hypothetical protein
MERNEQPVNNRLQYAHNEYLLSTAALADCVSGVHIFRFCT